MTGSFQKKFGRLAMAWRNKNLRRLILVGVVVLLGGIGSMIYVSITDIARPSASTVPTPGADFVQEVRSLTQVPKEDPVVATISDARHMTGNSLYLNAHDGDLLLIFPVSHWAVVYRPSSHTIISSGPLVLSSGVQHYSSP